MAVVLDTRFLIVHTLPPSALRDRISLFTAKISAEGIFASTVTISEFLKVGAVT